MRIGILAFNFANRETKHYYQGFLPRLIVQANKHEIIVFHHASSGVNVPKTINTRSIKLQSRLSTSLLFREIVFASQLKKYKLDILHSIDSSPPLRSKNIKIITLHNIAPIISQSYTSLSSKWFIKRAVKEAEHIIVPTKSYKKDIIKQLDLNESRISVIYESTNPNPQQSNTDLFSVYGVSKPYFISIEPIGPGKNFSRIMESFAKAKKDKSFPHQLVIVGESSKTDSIFQKQRELNLGNNIVFTRYIPQGDLTQLLIGATALLFPSLYEGFGLPILEAFAAGVPVLTSNISSMPEVAGDAALLVDPYNVDSIKQGIIKLAMDKELRQELIDKGCKRMEMFSWSRCARETINVYETFIGK